jgi:hypothetical protein
VSLTKSRIHSRKLPPVKFYKKDVYCTSIILRGKRAPRMDFPWIDNSHMKDYTEAPIYERDLKIIYL